MDNWSADVGEQRALDDASVERDGEDGWQLDGATHVLPAREFSRRGMLSALAGLGVGTIAFQRALAAGMQDSDGTVTAEMIQQAAWIADIELSEKEREEVAKAMQGNIAAAAQLRAIPVDADTVPALVFRPDFFYAQAAADQGDNVAKLRPAHASVQVSWSVDANIERKSLSDEDLAFASIGSQASLLAMGQLSSLALTELYLARLKQYDPLLKCVVMLLEESALESADAADKRRSKGNSLGVLDGIPWVAKDLIAVPPWKTTWGAEPFKDQVREETATVASRLQAAGAVLLGKVSLGAMAWGDQWFGGMTRNPWRPEEGSSGSSAGSASAVAAGLASFALGSETLGSIVSPTRRCRTSGLRPTFGRVSRAGCMPLSWSMDKIGPIARHADDLALVFAELLGIDGRDPTLVERSFAWPIEPKIEGLRLGVTGDRLSQTESQALDALKAAGATVVNIDLDNEIPVDAMNFILGTEASSVFEDAFRADPTADYGNWPSTFRESPFTPAMQYLRANRLRGRLIRDTEFKLAEVDLVLGGDDLLLTNLTGHPSIVIACSTAESRGVALPGVVKMTAKAYSEQVLLAVGSFLQATLPPSPARPPLS